MWLTVFMSQLTPLKAILQFQLRKSARHFTEAVEPLPERSRQAKRRNHELTKLRDYLAHTDE